MLMTTVFMAKNPWKSQEEKEISISIHWRAIIILEVYLVPITTQKLKASRKLK